MARASEVTSKQQRPSPDADVIVVGAGPAGMSAAIELGNAGLQVIVIEMQPAPGGQIFRALEANLAARPATEQLLGALGPGYSAGCDLIDRFRTTPGINYRPDTTVWELRADGTVGWLRAGTAGFLRARQVVLASGAMERPTPFPGWTLPGVMTAGAVQTLMKAGRLQPEGRIVLAGTGPLIFLLAHQLQKLGIRPALIARTDRFADKLRAIIRLRPAAVPAILKGLGWITRLRLAGIPMRTGISDLRAEGRDRVEAVRVTVSGQVTELPCDLLIVHDGVVPSIDLAHCAGLALEWRQEEASWGPTTTSDGRVVAAPGPSLTSGPLSAGPCHIRVSGDARKIAGADVAAAHGRFVARSIIAELKGKQENSVATEAALAAMRRAVAARPFIDAAFPIGIAAKLPDDSTIVCRCEEISAGTIRAAVKAGADDMNLIRGTLRCGMGPCQGRNCTVTLARLLIETGANANARPELFRARPPARPIPLGALVALSGVDPDLARAAAFHDEGADDRDA